MTSSKKSSYRKKNKVTKTDIKKIFHPNGKKRRPGRPSKQDQVNQALQKIIPGQSGDETIIRIGEHGELFFKKAKDEDFQELDWKSTLERFNLETGNTVSEEDFKVRVGVHLLGMNREQAAVFAGSTNPNRVAQRKWSFKRIKDEGGPIEFCRKICDDIGIDMKGFFGNIKTIIDKNMEEVGTPVKDKIVLQATNQLAEFTGLKQSGVNVHVTNKTLNIKEILASPTPEALRQGMVSSREWLGISPAIDEFEGIPDAPEMKQLAAPEVKDV